MVRTTALAHSSTPAGTGLGALRTAVRGAAGVGAAVIVAVLLTACEAEDEKPVEATPVGGSSTEAAAPIETAAPVEKAAPEVEDAFVMPAVEGMVLQDAQDTLQALGSFLLDQQDASGMDRMQIDDSNWVVCSQDPAAGTESQLGAVVVLASVKLDETCPGGSASGIVDDEAEADDEAQEPEAPEMTVAQAQAVRSAESYLRYSAFSKKGLIDQLEYEGFSKEDATFAVENVMVDWKEQALRSAESYLDYSAFSKKGLIDQLVFEGYTQKQAEYGVKNVEVDWMEQAVLSAESYLKYSAFSRSGLIDQLVFEGFTREQAEHGADEVGL